MADVISRGRRRYLESQFNVNRRQLIEELNRYNPKGLNSLQGLLPLGTPAYSHEAAKRCAARLAKLARKLGYPQSISDNFRIIEMEQHVQAKALRRMK